MDLKYKPEEFDKLLYNVHALEKGESPFERFEELNEITEFKMDLGVLNSQRDNIIKYIVYVYDPKTPLPRDLTERKQQAADLVGWKPKKGKFHSNIVNIFICDNKTVNEMIVKFCILINPTYGLWLSGKEAYEGMMKDLLAKPEGKRDAVKMAQEKTELFAKLEGMLRRLNALEVEILNFEKTRELREEMYKIAAKKEPLRLKPEHKADKQ